VVDLPKLGRRGVDDPLEFTLHGHIGDVPAHARGWTAERADRLVHLAPVAGAEADVAPLGNQCAADRPPDAARAARDHGHMIAQSEIHSVLPQGVAAR